MKWTSQLIAMQMIILALGYPSSLITTGSPAPAQSALAAASAYAVSAPADTWASTLDSDAGESEVLPLREQIAAWMAELSQTAEFASWGDADFTVYPLGPGQHGWVAVITLHEQDIGYLIVHAAKEGGPLSLTEYGSGPYPLFGQAALLHTLAWMDLRDPSGSAFEDEAQLNTLALQRHYKGPFEAIWEVNLAGQTYYIDAASGDDYSLLKHELQPQLLTPYQGAQTMVLTDKPLLTHNSKQAIFDPYETLSWIGRDGLRIDDWPQLQALLDSPGTAVTYAPLIWAEQIRQPLALNGYQIWANQQVYVTVQQGSSRYIPYQAFLALDQMASFYVDDSSLD